MFFRLPIRIHAFLVYAWRYSIAFLAGCGVLALFDVRVPSSAWATLTGFILGSALAAYSGKVPKEVEAARSEAPSDGR